MSVKLDILEIPEKHAKVALKRLSPFVEKYHRDQLLELKLGSFRNQFGLRELLISVYTQGVIDGEELNYNKK